MSYCQTRLSCGIKDMSAATSLLGSRFRIRFGHVLLSLVLVVCNGLCVCVRVCLIVCEVGLGPMCNVTPLKTIIFDYL